MNSLIKHLSATLILGSLFSSCSKEEVVSSPVITPKKPTAQFLVFSPMATDMYDARDTVFIHMNVSAEESLHGYNLSILTLPDSVSLFSLDAHTHKKSITVDTFWVNNLSRPENAIVRLEATLDHNGNTAVKEVPFSLNNP